MANFQCPTCMIDEKNVAMVRESYAGRWIFECPQCLGQLIGKQRLTALENRVDKDHDALKKELVSGGEDTPIVIRCPRCHLPMDKERFDDEQFMIDRCSSCESVWLDRGELAKIQLHHDVTEQATELAQMRHRLEHLTEEEQAEYESNLEKLPEKDFVVEVIRGGLKDYYLRHLFQWFR